MRDTQFQGANLDRSLIYFNAGTGGELSEASRGGYVLPIVTIPIKNLHYNSETYLWEIVE